MIPLSIRAATCRGADELAGRVIADHRRGRGHRPRGRARLRRARRAGGPHRPQRRQARGGARADRRAGGAGGQHRACSIWRRRWRATTTRSPTRSLERYGRLDGLLHNAGLLGTLSPDRALRRAHLVPRAAREPHRGLRPHPGAAAGAEEAPRTPRCCSPRAASGARGRAYWGAYAVSKFALEGLAQVLAEELEGISHVRVNALNPGRARTAMRRQAYPAEDLDDACRCRRASPGRISRCWGRPAAASRAQPSTLSPAVGLAPPAPSSARSSS